MRLPNKFRIFLLFCCMVFFIAVGLAWYYSRPPVDSSFGKEHQAMAMDSVALERGRYVAIASDCIACHTVSKGKKYAGGLPMPLPMGNIYSTNITPDKEYGIGHYSYEDLKNVLTLGVAPDGRRLYPAMPYTAYSKLSDEDIHDLYQFLMHGIEAVPEPNKKADFPWPLTMRWPVGIWNAIFLEEGSYQPKPAQGELWNRGAYLVQGAMHCGTCHTPRGVAMQEKAYDESGRAYLSGAKIGLWEAYNITNDPNSGIGAWHENELIQYLQTGSVPEKAQAFGSMGEAVEHSFSKMTTADLAAVAHYIQTISAVGDEQKQARSVAGQADQNHQSLRYSKALGQTIPRGQTLYNNVCASCHGVNGKGSKDAYYPSMFKNSVIGSINSNNLIMTIMYGGSVDNGQEHYFMPEFSSQLNDEEIADLVNYITETYGYGSSTVSAKTIKKFRNAQK